MKKWQEMKRMGAEKALVTFQNRAAIEEFALFFFLLKTFLP